MYVTRRVPKFRAPEKEITSSCSCPYPQACDKSQWLYLVFLGVPRQSATIPIVSILTADTSWLWISHPFCNHTLPLCMCFLPALSPQFPPTAPCWTHRLWLHSLLAPAAAHWQGWTSAKATWEPLWACVHTFLSLTHTLPAHLKSKFTPWWKMAGDLLFHTYWVSKFEENQLVSPWFWNH